MAIFKHFFRDLYGLSFVQIGANDGIDSDFVRDVVFRYGWVGVLVEPIPAVMQQLKKNYEGASVQFEEAAIVENVTDEEVEFNVCVDKTVSSALEVAHEKTIAEQAKGRIEKIMVQCMTYEQLVAAYEIKPDVVVIDTEGYDFKILRSIDYERYSPRVIVYEHAELADRSEVKAFLRAKGYRFMKFKNNKVAYL